MSKKKISEHTLGPRALEMVMRDVLGGMEELAVLKSYEKSGGVFEVISIDSTETESLPEACNTKTEGTSNSASVIPWKQHHNKKQKRK